MDLEANKLIFPEKKSPEKVDSRWWQMEDVNKYLRKTGRKVGQKVEERAQKAVDTRLTDWRRKQIFRRGTPSNDTGGWASNGTGYPA